jgi:tetratricopeptide (TPR) repeat protein
LRLERDGDEGGIAKAHLVAFQWDNASGKIIEGSKRARLAALHAGKAGDEGLRQRALGWYLTNLIWGKGDDRTLEHEVEEIARGCPGLYLEAFVDLARGEMCRLRGDFEQALRLAQRGLDRLETLGMRTMAAAGAFHLAWIHMSAGDPAAAIEALGRSDAILSELGERGYRSTIQAHLAAAYAALGAPELAAAACDLCEKLSASGDVINFVIIPRVRAALALADGDPQRALEDARSAVQRASETDFLHLHAAAKLELARVLVALARPDEAKVEAKAALELYKAKGDAPAMADAGEVLDEL